MGKIVWLASYPKSGNTWLRFFFYAYFALDPKKHDRLDVNDPGLRSFSAQDVTPDWFQPFLGMPVADAGPADFARVRPQAHRMIADSAPGMVIVKTHNVFEPDHGTHMITPDVTAGAIYVVRNPLDVVASVRDHYGHRTMGAAIDMLNRNDMRSDGGARHIGNLFGSWSRNVESWVGAPRRGVFPVRYEDLHENPEKIFAWLIGVLGKEVDEDRLRWAIGLTRFENLQRSETESGFSEASERGGAFFRKGVSGGWRDALTTGQVKRIVEKNHEMMRRFGYLDEKLERFAPKPKKAKTRR